MTQWRVTLWLYYPSPHISWGSSVGSALDLESKGCWFESTVRHYFSFNNIRPRPKIRMNEAWRIKLGILNSDKILIFSLFVGCFYRKGPALTQTKWLCYVRKSIFQKNYLNLQSRSISVHIELCLSFELMMKIRNVRPTFWFVFVKTTTYVSPDDETPSELKSEISLDKPKVRANIQTKVIIATKLIVCELCIQIIGQR